MKTYRIMVADDLGLARAGLVSLLAEWGQGEVVCQAANGAEAIAGARAARPDLVVMDLCLPGLPGYAGLDALGTVCSEIPDAQVVVLVEPEFKDLIPRAMAAGAAAHLMTNEEPSQLFDLLDHLTARDAVQLGAGIHAVR